VFFEILGLEIDNNEAQLTACVPAIVFVTIWAV